VLDVPFVSTDQNAMLEFSSNADLLPAQGADVEVVLTADKQAASAPEARMFISVDRLGRVELDGRRISLAALEEEAGRFLAAHSQASAEVRIDSQALVYDRQRVQEALRQAGLESSEFRMVNTTADVPPRTPEEADQALAQWRDQLARDKDVMGDPAEDVGRLLQALQRRQEELRALGDLWQRYAASLRAMVRNRATSQPAAQATQAAE
jgi:biopolymer transport protein ExbD